MKNLKRLALACSMLVMLTLGITAQTSVRETIRLDQGWKFAFGNAADPKKDFGCGTERGALRHEVQ